MALAALSLLVLAQVLAVSAQVCPNYMVNDGCTNGPCKDKGIRGKFKIPSNCTLIKGYGTGVFTLNGQLPEIPDDGIEVPSGSGSPNAVFTNTKIRALRRGSPSNCCVKCKAMNQKKNKNGQFPTDSNGKRLFKCDFWQFLDLGAYGGICFIYDGKTGPKCDTNILVNTRVGVQCKPTVDDDPHFVGAQGTQYDFNGLPDKTFALITDRNLHINMKMTGYLDERTESASLVKDGKAVRTWIRELGILWTVDGQQHSLRLVARAGKQTARGEGYLALAEADGTALPRMQVGDEMALEGGLALKFEALEKKGPYDVDFYTVRVGDLLDMDVRLRVANPLLQTAEEAETHISLAFNSIQTSPAVHGVLGQTYREGREARAEEFSKVIALLHHGIAADGETGKGFLDGTPADYMTSGVMETDCRFSQFETKEKPSVTSE